MICRCDHCEPFAVDVDVICPECSALITEGEFHEGTTFVACKCGWEGEEE